MARLLMELVQRVMSSDGTEVAAIVERDGIPATVRINDSRGGKPLMVDKAQWNEFVQRVNEVDEVIGIFKDTKTKTVKRGSKEKKRRTRGLHIAMPDNSVVFVGAALKPVLLHMAETPQTWVRPGEIHSHGAAKALWWNSAGRYGTVLVERNLPIRSGNKRGQYRINALGLQVVEELRKLAI